MKFLAILAILLLPAAVLSADGDACPAVSSVTVPGSYLISCAILCDSKTADGACSEVDLGAVGKGIPEKYGVMIVTKTACAGTLQVAVTGAVITGGLTTDIVTLTDSVGDAFVTQPPKRYIQATVTNGSACTDLDVYFYGYHQYGTH